MEEITKLIKKYSDTEPGKIEKRFCKLMEEVGEWTASFLEEDGFKIPKKIKTPEELRDHNLEEGCDTLIMVLDILFHQGFSIEEIEAKLKEKLDVWDAVLVKKNLKPTVVTVEHENGVKERVITNVEPVIIQNAMKCLNCGTIINSRHRHDYTTCNCENSIMVDGGHEYIRCSYGTIPNMFEDLTLNDTSPLKEKVDKMVWGTYGKNGDEPLKWVKLNECTTDHLSAILENARPNPEIQRVIRTILVKRNNKR